MTTGYSAYSIQNLKDYYEQKKGVALTKTPKYFKRYIYSELELDTFTLENQLKQQLERERGANQELVRLQMSNLHYRGKISRDPFTSLLKWARIQIELGKEISVEDFKRELEARKATQSFKDAEEKLNKEMSALVENDDDVEPESSNTKNVKTNDDNTNITLEDIDNKFFENANLRIEIEKSNTRHIDFLKKISEERIINQQLISEGSLLHLLHAIIK